MRGPASWLTLEELVTELGGVCSARDEAKSRVDHVPPEVEDSLREATQAVTAALTDPASDPADPGRQDEVVRAAWAAIAVAQDRIAKLSAAMARARDLHDRSQQLQDQSRRLRLRDRRPG
jgi:hypothetical protein